MAQVSENRSKLHDAVMHDDIIREKGRLLRRGECGMRDVGKTKSVEGTYRNQGWKSTVIHVFHEYTSISLFYKISSHLICNILLVKRKKVYKTHLI